MQSGVIIQTFLLCMCACACLINRPTCHDLHKHFYIPRVKLCSLKCFFSFSFFQKTGHSNRTFGRFTHGVFGFIDNRLLQKEILQSYHEVCQ